MAPAYFDEYESRAGYYEEWLKKQPNGNKIPDSPEERHKLLIAKRIEIYQQLCDAVYEKKGFTSRGVPKRETVEKFGLMDEQANHLLSKFGV